MSGRENSGWTPKRTPLSTAEELTRSGHKETAETDTNLITVQRQQSAGVGQAKPITAEKAVR